MRLGERGPHGFGDLPCDLDAGVGAREPQLRPALRLDVRVGDALAQQFLARRPLEAIEQPPRAIHAIGL